MQRYAQTLSERIEATHASIVVSRGDQKWTLFTGPKGEAAKALDAMVDLLNIAGVAGRTGLEAQLVYFTIEADGTYVAGKQL